MKRSFVILFVILSGVALVLFFNIRNIPEIHDVLLDETALVASLNNDKVSGIKNSIRLIQAEQSYSYSPDLSHLLPLPPDILHAQDLAIKTSVVTDSVSIWFDQTIADCDILHLKQNIGEIKEVLNDSVFQYKSIMGGIDPLMKSIDQINETDEYYLKVLQLENIRSEALGILQTYLDSLISENNIGAIRLGGGEIPKLLEGSSIGLISFNPPANMELDQKYRIKIKISKNLKENLIEQMASDQASIDSLLVGDIMIVRLLGEDFTIVSHDEEEQGVLEDDYTQWEFDVTPEKSGLHTLFVKAGIVYYVPNLGPAKKFFPVYEREIKIEVDNMKMISSFITERWEFLVSSFLIPGLMWIFSEIKRRRKGKVVQSATRSDTLPHNL